MDNLISRRDLISIANHNSLNPSKVNTYEDVEEPQFDPKVHLDLHHPEYIRLLTNFEKTKKYPVVNDHNGSPFAYSAPFQVCGMQTLSYYLVQIFDIVARS